MKILHLIDSCGLYGAEIMLLSLVKEQQKIGLYPEIGSIGELGITEKPLELAAKKARISVKKFRMKSGLNVLGMREILSYCHSNGFHLMHSHGYKADILFGFLPKRIRKIPIVTTLHGWTSVSNLSKMRIYEWLDARSLRFIDAVAVVNKNMLKNRRFPTISDKKLFVIDNGIPLDLDADVVLDQDIVDFCQEGVVLGSIGRYSPEKGYDTLLKTIRVLHEQGLKIKLVLVGDGTLRGDLEGLAADLGIADCVFLTGYRTDAAKYMSLMNIYVISSLTEGLPITLLEAMRAKIPIVATSVGGIPNVLEDNQDALLVPPTDIDQLTSAINQVLSNPGGAFSRSENSYEKFIGHYSAKKMAAAYASVYKKVGIEGGL